MLLWDLPRARLLLFGYLLAFLSSFGQTFFIGLFSAELQAATGLGHAGLGTVYTVSTLSSGLILLWAGALIDRVRLRIYLTGALLFYAFGCILLGFATNMIILGLAVFLLRFSGQGLFSHIAITTVARNFHHARGRALSISYLGHPTGEALLPPLFVFLMAGWAWQSLWFAIAVTLLVLLPVLLVLPGAMVSIPATDQSPAGTDPDKAEGGSGHKTRGEVVRDWRFYMILPTLLAPGFVGTGIFIHQIALIGEKGWTVGWFALNFTGFAIAQVVGNLGAGQLVDRLTARHLMPYFLLPMGFGAAAVSFGNHPILATLLLVGAGLTIGSMSPITNAMWVERYGTRYLGAIRALAISIIVVSSALSPALFGFLIDGGVRFDHILLGCALWIAGSSLLAGRS